MTTYYKEFQKVLLSVDCIIFGFDQNKLKILIGRRNMDPGRGEWSLYGGFVRNDESLDAAAQRTLLELTGLRNIYMSQVGAFGNIDRDPGERVVSIAYYALINVKDYSERLRKQHGVEWVNIEDIPQMYSDHNAMVAKARKLIQQKIKTNPVGFELLPELFTLTQLQRLYEAVNGEPLDKRNFRKRIKDMDFIEKTELIDKKTSKRGASLYRFKELKAKVFKANLDLVKQGLVIFTWGNVSGIDREKGLVVIKPSGVSYDEMKASDMVVVDLESGKVVEGDLNPSSDTPTHLVLYKAFPNIQGVVHTHSTYATAFAQAGRDIPNIGTTHADYFYKDIPCTRDMTKEEVEGQYELETGNVIVDEILNIRKINPDHTPAVLVKNHGPFSWGTSPDNAVYNAKVMEQCAKMAFVSFMVNPATTMNPLLVEKHYMRKHGPNAYYGQKGQKH